MMQQEGHFLALVVPESVVLAKPRTLETLLVTVVQHCTFISTGPITSHSLTCGSKKHVLGHPETRSVEGDQEISTPRGFRKPP